LRHLERAKNLEILDLSASDVTAGGLRSIAKLHELRRLVFPTRTVTDDEAAYLGMLPKLELAGDFRFEISDQGL
jgi:hypothetical protein